MIAIILRNPMRYDAEHKQKTRQKVLKVAARAIRADGPERVAVAGVMAKAGLTHGGFYAHFASKDDLVAEAIGEMFDDGVRHMASLAEGLNPAQALSAYVDFYLSGAHLQARAVGCPLPALSADVPRLPETARRRFGEGLARLTGALARLAADAGLAEPEAAAASALAEMAGALALARAVADPAQCDAILDHTRRAVKRRLGLETRP